MSWLCDRDQRRINVTVSSAFATDAVAVAAAEVYDPCQGRNIIPMHDMKTSALQPAVIINQRHIYSHYKYEAFSTVVQTVKSSKFSRTLSMSLTHYCRQCFIVDFSVVCLFILPKAKTADEREHKRKCLNRILLRLDR